MADGRGLPLLSGPPPSIESSESCRKCAKEFNLFLNRSRKCNHCGYSYCHSCTDYQALMPRGGQDAGYDSMNVCAYCIDFLQITAAGKGRLKGLPLGKLRKYAEAYNIKIDRAVEKDDVIECILNARTPAACLPRENENFYRRYSVPNRAGTNRRGFFSRTNPSNPPPPPPQRPAQRPSYNFARPDLEPDDPPQQQYHPPRQHYAPPPGPPPGQHHQRQQPLPPQAPPVPPRPDSYYHHSPPPMPGNHPGQSYGYHQSPPHAPRSPPRSPRTPHPPPQMPSYPPYPPPHVPHTSRPASTHPYQRPSSSNSSNNPHQPTANHSPPHARAASAAPPPSAAPPTLDELLNMTSEAIGSLSISALKAILFTNHVNVGVILEKSDLVAKVKVLAADERRERERQRVLEEQEEAERVERQRVLLEQFRVQREREERIHNPENAEGEDGKEDDQAGSGGPEAHVDSDASTTPPIPAPKTRGSAADLERTGLCVICQDEEANIAIVDCGHLAMCRGCSDLIMASSRECPLCRTRIVTDGRLLRIFRS